MTQFTSKAIEESFIRLLNERPLDKITIKDIVDDCGISRNTFYYHFQDITALLEHILNADVERVLSQHLDMDSWEDGFISAARFALENKRLVYHIYNSVSRERVERYLYSIAGEVMRLYVSRITEQVEHAAHKKNISRRSENGGRFLQICPGWHDFRLAEHRNEERSGGTDPACRRDFPRKYRSSPDPCVPLIWTFVHVCTYFGLFKSNAQFLCIAFFCPFSRLDSLHTIPIEKESTTKGALFYEIW